MTENEAIKELKYDCNELGKAIPCDTSWGKSFENAYAMAIKALEEVQQYRAIGTPEECRAAVDKRTVMKPIRMDKCTCPSCGTHNEVWKKRRNTLPSDIVYCWHCGQAVEIFRRDEE